MENDLKRKIVNKKFIAGLLTGSILLGAYACSRKPQKEVIIQTVVVTPTPTPTTETTKETTTPTTTTEESVNPYWAWEDEKQPTETTKETTTPTTTTEESVNPNWAWSDGNNNGNSNKNTPTPKPTTAPTTEETVNPNWAFEGDQEERYKQLVDTYNKINYEIENFSFDKVKEKAINYSKELIDFVFYGGTINGLTFDELKDETKQEVYARLQRIDAFIMQYIPDYKEKIGEKYNWVKDFASTTLQKAKDVFNSHIEINVNVTKGNSKNKKLTLNKKSE